MDVFPRNTTLMPKNTTLMPKSTTLMDVFPRNTTPVKVLLFSATLPTWALQPARTAMGSGSTSQLTASKGFLYLINKNK